MIKKSSPRTLPSVYRDNGGVESSSTETAPSWYNDFIDNLQKNSVNSQKSIYDEISAILGNVKSKYSSVEEAVNDMKERTGLAAFLNKKVIASAKEPEIFQKIPVMKAFIDNFVQDRPGTGIESVIHDMLKIDDIRNQLPNNADVDDEVKAYINAKIVEAGSHYTDSNSADFYLGKADQSTEVMNDDPLAICEPSKIR